MISIPQTLVGHLLLSFPDMRKSESHKAVVFIAHHSKQGSMGFVINQMVDEVEWCDVFQMLSGATYGENEAVLWGGPVEMNRGFVLHSSDYKTKGTVSVDQTHALTADHAFFSDLSKGVAIEKPADFLLLLGCVKWRPGQLEEELAQHEWLLSPSNAELTFRTPLEEKWHHASTLLGIPRGYLTCFPGEA